MVNRVFLVGYMGCGKSTIGRYVASDLGWSFIDADAEFEAAVGTSISDFWAANGEEAFRAKEQQIIADLARRDNVIVATGGGAPCFGSNMDTMNRAGLTIYISVEPEILAARLAKAKSRRPLLADKSDDELLEFIKTQLASREPFYNKARMIVDGERLPFSSYRMFIETFPEDDLI